ncbi:DUF1499 domain-containing protein [Leptolyngbya sp. KIOST-1]|uniref:DUF1499 domain-containing protein n=1 Tax=Leptolyngbya sp. KIOST-1 TaxID=1229172 RepID=UPI0006916293|nr:DUF1499 domain-containing protein [Leptolyngbya sp. KIOST-1]
MLTTSIRLVFGRLVFGIALAALLLLGDAEPSAAASLEVGPIAALPFVGNLAGDRPTNLGIESGHLAPCPASPNCVVSQGDTDSEHSIAPLAYSGDPSQAMAQLAAVVTAMPRTEIIEQGDRYLYAEFTSRWMGYVDDVEFYLDPEASVIQVRSASRLGESDLGVNRQRIETIRQAFSS